MQLIGRDLDVEFVRGFVDDAAVRGGALLVSGDAGVGKTALLDVAALHAEAAGTRVVRAVGAEFEAELAFRGSALFCIRSWAAFRCCRLCIAKR